MAGSSRDRRPAAATAAAAAGAARRGPFATRLAAATIGTGWLAAGFGTITIVAAGDLDATGTVWLFGWPFLAMLLAVSAAHLLVVGAGEPYGLPPLLPGIRALHQALASRAAGRPVPPEILAAALPAASRLAARNAALGAGMALLVVLVCVVLEAAFAQASPSNVWVILRAGLYASALYGTASLALGEMIVRGPCRDLRRQAPAHGLEPYGDFVVPGIVRVVAGVVPTSVALFVAVEIALAPGSPSVGAFVALILLSACTTAVLGYLQHLNRRASVDELLAGCRDLVAGTETAIVTGSVDAPVVEMAREFNAAAAWVRADRRASNERYRALFEGAADGIVLVEPVTGRVVQANARAVELLGRSVPELQTRRYEELLSPATRAADPVLSGPGLRPGETAVVHGEVVRADGGRRPVDVALSVVPTAEGWLVQAILHDVSERKRIEDELAAQNAALRAARDQLLAHDRAKTEFLGTVSHELRTPLNVFIGYTEILLDSNAHEDMPVAERADILRRLLASGRTLAALVEDTLSVLRLDAGTVRLQREPASLEELFRELHESDRLLRPAGPVEERWVIEPGLPALVTDRRKLRQIVSNLVGNARKFTEAGFVEVRAGKAPDGDGIRITVADSGCGIPAEHQQAVFEAYRQVASRRAAEGCGLGLYIVRRYVELLGGTVACRSAVGAGTTFVVDLPLRGEGAVGRPRPDDARASAPVETSLRRRPFDVDLPPPPGASG
jgi:PAS domain S-box-containing protein